MKGHDTKRIVLIVVVILAVIVSIFRMVAVLGREPIVIETLSSSPCITSETLVCGPSTMNSTEITEKDITKVIDEQFPVYICGSVLEPGVYDISRGTFMYQLIDLAGGLTEDAAVNHVNQVFMIVEPISIYIPSSDDVSETPDQSDTSLVRNENDIYVWGGSEVLVESTKTDSMVNINTAGREELMTLTGVGQATADSIIQYRDTVARFTRIEDIMNVPGIKTARFEAIKHQITI